MQAMSAVLAANILIALAPGGPPVVQLRLEQATLELGESTSVKLVYKDTPEPDEAPSLSAPDGILLELVNPIPSTTRRTQIINGRRTGSSTYTYHYRLTATEPGRYMLGPVNVQAGGKTFTSNRVGLVVRRPDVTEKLDGDRFLFVHLDVEPKSLYVTEDYVATLRIGIREAVENGQRADLDYLRSVIDQRGSQFSVFATGANGSRRQVRLSDSSGTPHLYHVYTFEKSIRADEPGAVAIGPVFVRAAYPVAWRRDLFGTRVSRTRRETARAKAIEVTIKSPPDEGRPSDFTGTIGQFSMKVTATPTRVEQGHPVTLAISIHGTPIEGIAGPDLGAQPELASRFDFARDELVGDIEHNAKVFRRAVFPKQQGEQSIPPIRWSFFDPKTQQYRTLTSDPIAITVDAAAPGSSPIARSGGGEAADDETTLTLLSAGIRPNYVDVESVLADQGFALTRAWLVPAVAPPLIWLVVVAISGRRARYRADAGLARRRRAARIARRALDRAVRRTDPADRLTGLADALTDYLASRYDLPPGQSTPAELSALLGDRGADIDVAKEIAAFLEACGRARYAPGIADGAATARAAQDVRRWIKRIEKITP